VAGKALPFLQGRVRDSFPGSRILVAFKAEIGNGFGYLSRSFRKMKIVAHRTVLIGYRSMNEPVLEKGFVPVLGLGYRTQEQHRQDDKQERGVISGTGHPGMLITVHGWCQQGRIPGTGQIPGIQNPESRIQNTEEDQKLRSEGYFSNVKPQTSNPPYTVGHWTLDFGLIFPTRAKYLTY
jgi:hypothetical protein